MPLSRESLVERLHIQPFFVPIDLQGGSGGHVSGDWLRFTGDRCLIVLCKAAGTDGDDPTITVSQATSAAGGSSKALTFQRIYRLEAEAATLTSNGTYTLSTQTAASTYTHTSLAQSAAVILIEVKAEDLDCDGGFKFLNVTIADTGSNAQLGCCLAIFSDLRFGGTPENHESCIA